jgi:hypothetical protein
MSVRRRRIDESVLRSRTKRYSRRGWKSKGPRRLHAGSDNGRAVDHATNLEGSGKVVGDMAASRYVGGK